MIPYPEKAYVEITNVCNLHCDFCHGTCRTPQFMSVREFEYIAEKLRSKVKYLYLHLMGEPLLHPQFAEILRIAVTYGFRVMLTTNGTLLRETPVLLEPECAPFKVSISLHSFEGNTAGAADYGALRSYVCTCTDFCKRASRLGTICVLRLWNENTVSNYNTEILGMLHESFMEPWGYNRNGSKLAEKVFLEWGERFVWPDATGAVSEAPLFCYGLRNHIGILCDGTVVPCCLDSDGIINLGSIYTHSLEEILNGARARSIYDGFTRHEAVESLCRTCSLAHKFR